MAVYSHDAEADVWDCELSDDDESSLFSSLPPKQPQRNVVPAISTAPAPAQAEVLSTTSPALQALVIETRLTEGHQRSGRRRGKRKRGAAGLQQTVSI